VQVICWLLLSGAYPETDGPTTLKLTAWENRPSNTVAAKRWGINKVTPGLICCAAVFVSDFLKKVKQNSCEMLDRHIFYSYPTGNGHLGRNSEYLVFHYQVISIFTMKC